jgi:hypothetical protein
MAGPRLAGRGVLLLLLALLQPGGGAGEARPAGRRPRFVWFFTEYRTTTSWLSTLW